MRPERKSSRLPPAVTCADPLSSARQRGERRFVRFARGYPPAARRSRRPACADRGRGQARGIRRERAEIDPPVDDWFGLVFLRDRDDRFCGRRDRGGGIGRANLTSTVSTMSDFERLEADDADLRQTGAHLARSRARSPRGNPVSCSRAVETAERLEAESRPRWRRIPRASAAIGAETVRSRCNSATTKGREKGLFSVSRSYRTLGRHFTRPRSDQAR